MRAAAAAAVAVVVAGGGYGLVTLLTSGGQPEPSSSAGRPASQGGGGPAFNNQGPEGAPAGVTLPNVVHSGTDYQPGRVAAQVSTVLAQSPPTPARGTGGVSNSPMISFGAFRDLRACVSRVTGGSTPRLVDIARYQGQPAAIIVADLPHSRELAVSVVGTGCSGSASDILTRTMVTTAP